MSGAAPNHAHARQRGHLLESNAADRRLLRSTRPLAALTMVVGLLLVWVGCSVEKHYALLSMFFDGVPDPALIRQGATAVEIARRTGGVIYTHEPYRREQCGDCHTSSVGMMLAEVKSSVCVNCHQDVRDAYPHMHGPVAAEACLWCHAPHESTVETLLRVPSQQLCQQCHGMSLGRRRAEIPEHRDPERNCLDCHSGHGGETRAYLRADRSVSFSNP
jgi:predicted CXXCH cytochrome family protein